MRTGLWLSCWLLLLSPSWSVAHPHPLHAQFLARGTSTVGLFMHMRPGACGEHFASRARRYTVSTPRSHARSLLSHSLSRALSRTLPNPPTHLSRTERFPQHDAERPHVCRLSENLGPARLRTVETKDSPGPPPQELYGAAQGRGHTAVSHPCVKDARLESAETRKSTTSEQGPT